MAPPARVPPVEAPAAPFGTPAPAVAEPAAVPVARVGEEPVDQHRAAFLRAGAAPTAGAVAPRGGAQEASDQGAVARRGEFQRALPAAGAGDMAPRNLGPAGATRRVAPVVPGRAARGGRARDGDTPGRAVPRGPDTGPVGPAARERRGRAGVAGRRHRPAGAQVVAAVSRAVGRRAAERRAAPQAGPRSAPEVGRGEERVGWVAAPGGVVSRSAVAGDAAAADSEGRAGSGHVAPARVGTARARRTPAGNAGEGRWWVGPSAEAAPAHHQEPLPLRGAPAASGRDPSARSPPSGRLAAADARRRHSRGATSPTPGNISDTPLPERTASSVHNGGSHGGYGVGFGTATAAHDTRQPPCIHPHPHRIAACGMPPLVRPTSGYRRQSDHRHGRRGSLRRSRTVRGGSWCRQGGGRLPRRSACHICLVRTRPAALAGRSTTYSRCSLWVFHD